MLIWGQTILKPYLEGMGFVLYWLACLAFTGLALLTALLDIWVRQREVLSLEKAVHKLTAVPAALFGIPDRGTLAAGKMADLVLFDPQTVAAKPPEYVQDFPHHGRRLISRTDGIVATFVAGTQVYEHGTHTGAFPGRVLRSDE